MGASAPFWRFSAASYPDLEGTNPADSVIAGARDRTVPGETDAYVGVCASQNISLLLSERHVVSL